MLRTCALQRDVASSVVILLICSVLRVFRWPLQPQQNREYLFSVTKKGLLDDVLIRTHIQHLYSHYYYITLLENLAFLSKIRHIQRQRCKFLESATDRPQQRISSK